MELDLQKGVLSFFVDNTADFNFIKNIQRGNDIKYRMFVCMYYEDNHVEIANFSITAQ